MLVELPNGMGLVKGRRSRLASRLFQRHKYIETTVYRIALPTVQDPEQPYVLADAVVLEKDAAGIPLLSDKWVAPGIYRAIAYINRNRRSLAPFLASGARELDLKEAE